MYEGVKSVSLVSDLVAGELIFDMGSNSRKLLIYHTLHIDKRVSGP